MGVMLAADERATPRRLHRGPVVGVHELDPPRPGNLLLLDPEEFQRSSDSQIANRGRGWRVDDRGQCVAHLAAGVLPVGCGHEGASRVLKGASCSTAIAHLPRQVRAANRPGLPGRVGTAHRHCTDCRFDRPSSHDRGNSTAHSSLSVPRKAEYHDGRVCPVAERALGVLLDGRWRRSAVCRSSPAGRVSCDPAPRAAASTRRSWCRARG